MVLRMKGTGQVLGEDRVIAGTVTSAIGRKGPGDIILERYREWLWLAQILSFQVWQTTWELLA